jgi:hypothetical protein
MTLCLLKLVILTVSSRDFIGRKKLYLDSSNLIKNAQFVMRSIKE